MNNFETLFHLDVNEHVEKKKTGNTQLSYLSWAWAWAEVKKHFPEATYDILKFENNLPYVYDKNTGYMVFTQVTIDGLTHEMWLPVMDGANKAMKSVPQTYSTKYSGEKTVEVASMFDINKTIMRCLVKNLAMFGLGLYIYSGEDLPETPFIPLTERQLDDLNKLAKEKVELEGKNEEITHYLGNIAKHYEKENIEELSKEDATKAIVIVKAGIKNLKKAKPKEDEQGTLLEGSTTQIKK